MERPGIPPRFLTCLVEEADQRTKGQNVSPTRGSVKARCCSSNIRSSICGPKEQKNEHRVVEEEKSCRCAQGEPQKDTPLQQASLQTEPPAVPAAPQKTLPLEGLPLLLLGGAFRPGPRGEWGQQTVRKRELSGGRVQQPRQDRQEGASGRTEIY